MDFILGLGIALPVTMGAGIAVVTGVAEGVSHQQKMNEEASSETRQLKFHIDVAAANASSSNDDKKPSKGRDWVQGTMVVLHSDRLWLEKRDGATRQPVRHHPFTGFYIPYPDEDRMGMRGLVSTISRDPPVLNWIYVDRETHELKYSNRTGSIKHHVGPWDWTEETGPDSCVTFDDWEGVVAVEEGEGKWGLYFDIDDDGLGGRQKGRRKVEVSLYRRVISEQEVNKWGLGTSGNLGVKKTEHQVKGKDMLDKEEG